MQAEGAVELRVVALPGRHLPLSSVTRTEHDAHRAAPIHRHRTTPSHVSASELAQLADILSASTEPSSAADTRTSANTPTPVVGCTGSGPFPIVRLSPPVQVLIFPKRK